MLKRLKNVLFSVIFIFLTAFIIVGTLGLMSSRTFANIAFKSTAPSLISATDEFDIRMPKFSRYSLIEGTMPILSAIPKATPSNKVVAALPQEKPTPAPSPAPTSTNVCDVTILKGKTDTNVKSVQINNDTDYTIDIATLLSQPFELKYNKGEPQVLIVHTHTSEAYTPSEMYNYTPTDVDRTEDINFNVARVGKELSKSLEKKGVNVIHDPSINDYPSYNGSYKKSLELIQQYLKNYPSIKIVIDLHRDAMIQNDGSKIRTVCNINGVDAAQVMLVVGTDANGLAHPDWRKNLSLGVKLQQKLNIAYPGIVRPLNLRKERFNGHISPGEILIEFGTTGNTLDEALLSANYVGEVIADFIINQS